MRLRLAFLALVILWPATSSADALSGTKSPDMYEPPNPTVERCVRDGVFELELPSAFSDPWTRWDVSVP